MFNTLRYAKKLEEVGVSRAQAEAHIQIISEIVEGDLTTKQDLRELEHRLTIKHASITGAMLSLAVAIIAIIIRLH